MEEQEDMVILIEALREQLSKRGHKATASLRIGVTEGLMQQIHCTTNPAGFELLLQEQLRILQQMLQRKDTTVEKELAEDFADKVWLLDIREDINQPLPWEITPPDSWQNKLARVGYIAIILVVLGTSLVGIKTIFDYFFFMNS